MQFAGQRTDENLQPIGEPYDVLVRLNDDTLPSPDALLVTGISPQSTQIDGMSEAEFAKLLSEEIFTPDTVTIGFNNIRFDDEFIRYLLWRNFYDPYEWGYKDGRSRWDLLDVVRMTRALRPNGIKWPVDKNGAATNKLELLSRENDLEHTKAHDALSDVTALIAVTKLIREKQPQLFEFLFSIREKNAVKSLVNLDEKKPFVYVSGRYDAQFNKATVAFPLTSARNGNVVVYDLRHDPSPFFDLDESALHERMFASSEERKAEGFLPVPIKRLQYNHAPAVAPLGVLEQHDGWQKISLEKATIEKNMKLLLTHPDFAEKIRSVTEVAPEFSAENDPEAMLYDGFLSDKDRLRVESVRNASARELADFHPEFSDDRLSELLLHYKARSFPDALSDDEQMRWESWRSARIKAGLSDFLERLQARATEASDDQRFILEELQLWAENIVPLDET